MTLYIIGNRFQQGKLLYIPQIKMPGNVDNIVKMFVYLFKTFLNFRMSEN